MSSENAKPKGVPDIAPPTITSRRKPRKANRAVDQEERENFLEENPSATLVSHSISMPDRTTRSMSVAEALTGLRRRDQAAEAFYDETDWLSGQFTYAAMPLGYRQFREDHIVRKCVIIRATWATKAGFDVQIEPLDEDATDAEKKQVTEKYADLRTYLNKCNKTVDMNSKLRKMTIRAKLQGFATQQIVYAKQAKLGLEIGDPLMLVPLRSDYVKPYLLPDWTFAGIGYKGRGSKLHPAYLANELLHFVNEDLDEDKRGLSDIEPIQWVVEARQRILQDDLPEAVTALWCATILWFLNRDKLPPSTKDDDDAVSKLLKAHIKAIAKPAKHVATTTNFDPPTVIDMKPDLSKLMEVNDKLSFEIIRNFSVPRFLMGYEEEVNKATAGEVIRAWVDGPVTDDQLWQRRNIEAQWYDRLGRRWLTKHQNLGEDEELPVRILHKPRPIQFDDFIELIRIGTEAYGNGQGPMDLKKVYEFWKNGRSTQFDPNEVEEKPTREIPLDFFARPQKPEKMKNQEE